MRLSIAALALPIALFVSSCQSAPPDLVAQSAGEEEQIALDSVELRLLDLRLAPDPSGLSEVRAELDRDAGRPGLSRLLRARVAALRGEAALLAGDTNAAKGFADVAAALSDNADGLWLVRAALETDPAKRLGILEQGISKAERKSRLLCERGSALLEAGRYAEAAQDLDEGLRGLNPRYRELYGSARERAFALAQAARETGSVQPIEQAESLQEPITIRVMVERAFQETRFLSAFSPEPKPSAQSVRPSLKNAGLLLDPEASLDSGAPRKTVAFFLWGIVSRMERDPSLLQKYRTTYTSTPVADVPVDAPWFDAVLGVVERELMDLPDGVHFMPDDPVTGLEYMGMLGKLKSAYR
jgi:tetratricopeptide (TPR) repeat protein